MPKGPGPYVNTVPAEGQEPMMEYVPFDKTDIGANAAGMPKGAKPGKMGIQHVGGAVSAKGV